MSFFDEEDVETLVNLGLSNSQAEIFLTLLSLGCADAKTIAKIMQKDCSDVYRRLKILNEKGLVEKILHTPNKYKPIPIVDAIEILIGPKNKEYEDLLKKIELLSKKRFSPVAVKNEKDWFSVISLPRSIQLIKKLGEKVQKEWVIYSQIERIPSAITTSQGFQNDPIERGIRYRVILELSQPTDEIVKFIKDYQKEYPNYKVRYTDTCFLVSFAICDQKKMSFAIEETKGGSGRKGLVTDNPQLIKVVYDYFNLRWKMAMKEYPKKMLPI